MVMDLTNRVALAPSQAHLACLPALPPSAEPAVDKLCRVLAAQSRHRLSFTQYMRERLEADMPADALASTDLGNGQLDVWRLLARFPDVLQLCEVRRMVKPCGTVVSLQSLRLTCQAEARYRVSAA